MTANLAGILSLKNIAVQSNDDVFWVVHHILVSAIREEGKADKLKQAEPSIECTDAVRGPEDRDPPNPLIESAMRVLAHPSVSNRRGWSYSAATTACTATVNSEVAAVRLEHVFFDNVDLSWSELQCSQLSQSRFRRTSFYGANLQGADLRGAHFNDEVPGFSERLAAVRRSSTRFNATHWLHEEEPEWRRYRCWITDLRKASLDGAQLHGARLMGADLSGASLQGAKLWDANVSRANFRWSNITREQLGQACANDPPLHDLGADVVIRGCP